MPSSLFTRLVHGLKRVVAGRNGANDDPGATAAEPKGSLAYRQNRDAIIAGAVPEKYTRIRTVVPGRRVLEVGAAEGVLSLLLSLDKDAVIALERQEHRHEEAKRLQAAWAEREPRVSRCEMTLGDLRTRPDLLDRVDTLVAVRMIYYLEEELEPVFRMISEKVENVVLCGNSDRAAFWERHRGGGLPRTGFGPYDYYATGEGMKSLLEKVGYRIETYIPEGDAIVVGTHRVDPAA